MMAADPSRAELDLSQRILDAAPRIRAFLRRLGGGGQDCDDLVQDVLERALRYRHAYDEALGDLDHWMMKTAFRTWLDHRSRRARVPRALGDADVEVRAGGAHPAELRDEVAFALQQLSPVEQDVVVRFHQNRESIQQIGRELQMPAGTVKSHLHRARRKLAATDPWRDAEEER